MSIGDTKKLGTVGVRTLVFYLATTALAVSVALTVGNLINPGVGLDMSSIQSSASSVETMEATSLTDTILNIIPDNPINSLASGTMLQVIVFALIVGVILAKMGERAETVANFFSQFNDIMMEMTMMYHGTCTDRCILPYQQNLCKHRFQRIYPAGKIYDRCSPCTGDPVLRRIPDPAEDLHRTESDKIHQEIFPVWHLHSQQLHPNATIPMSIDTLSKKVGVSKKISSIHHSSWSYHQHGRCRHHHYHHDAGSS